MLTELFHIETIEIDFALGRNTGNFRSTMAQKLYDNT